jgi:hypothetical protein
MKTSLQSTVLKKKVKEPKHMSKRTRRAVGGMKGCSGWKERISDTSQ